MKGTTKLEKGGWTLSLRKMAIDVMDKMILRPVTILVSDPRNGNINTFQGIRDKLIRKKYAFLSNWKDDVLKVFSVARNSNDPLINDICTELEQFFTKKYNILEEFSEFKFRDALARLLGKETVEDEEITTENIASNEINDEIHKDPQEVQVLNENDEIPENNNDTQETQEQFISNQDHQENNNGFQDIQGDNNLEIQPAQDNINIQEVQHDININETEEKKEEFEQ